MNIKVQMCGLVLLTVIGLLYIHQHTLWTFSKDAFRKLYLSTGLCIIMDILSIVIIENSVVLPELLVTVVCKGYLITLVITAFCGVLYSGVDICLYQPEFMRHKMKLRAVALTICILIGVLPLNSFFDPKTHVVYTYGQAALVTYLGAVGFIILNVFLIVKYRGVIRNRRARAMIVWMTCWIVAAIIQFFDAELLIVGFGACLGVAVVYIQFENPEINLDRVSGMFNQTAFTEYMEQIYYSRSRYAAYVFINQHRFSGNDDGQWMQQLGLELLKESCLKVFRTSDDEIVALVKENRRQTAASYIEEIVKGFRDYNLRILHLEDCLVARKAEDFFALLRYCRKRRLTNALQGVIEVDSHSAEEMYAEDALMDKVEAAVEADRVEVYLQPIYSTKEHAFTSAEALVRMFDEDGKLLPVYESVCALEESGLIHQLGETVFERICEMLRDRQLDQLGVKYIEVNLSVAQCSDERLADKYIAIMEQYAVDPSYINLEITESATIETKHVLQENMNRLIEYGVKFSLDDFGTGQSNLNYIVEMPVQVVKFDREMVLTYFREGRGHFVMNAAIHMIHDMQMHIVAEGIEEEAQLVEMERLGIDYIQGYYFSKPLPMEAYIDFVRKQWRKE